LKPDGTTFNTQGYTDPERHNVTDGHQDGETDGQRVADSRSYCITANNDNKNNININNK